MDILDQLRRDEGTRNKPYTDSVGKLTIGVGFNLTDVGLYPEEVEFILENRVGKLDAVLRAYAWYTPLDEVRKGAILNMAYNMGVGDLLHFPSMIHYLTAGDYPNAAKEMLNSVWATQVGERAQRLAMQMQTGAWV